jgi:hypothetical protein
MFDLTEVREVNIMSTSKRKEGCIFVKMERDQTKKDVIFTWENPAEKSSIQLREFLPKRLPQMTDEDWKKSIQLSASRLAHIARAYTTEAEFATLKPDNKSDSMEEKNVQMQWIEVTTKIGKMLKPKLDSGALKTDPQFITAMKVIKVENKGKWYTALPKVPPFLSTPNHPKNFEWDPKYDKLEIPQKGGITPDAEMPTQGGGGAATGEQTNAFAGEASASGSDDF